MALLEVIRSRVRIAAPAVLVAALLLSARVSAFAQAQPDRATTSKAEIPIGGEPRPNATPTLAMNRESSWIGAGVALGVLNLPKVGVGGELLGELRTHALWPIEFTLTYWFDNHAELGAGDLDLMIHPYLVVPYPQSGSRLRVSGAQVGAATCPFERHMGSDSLLFCGGVQGGLVHVRSEGFIGASSKTRATFEFQVLARYHFRLAGPLGISYSAGLFVALLRERFGYADRLGQFQQAYRSAPVGGRLDLALTYAF